MEHINLCHTFVFSSVDIQAMRARWIDPFCEVLSSLVFGCNENHCADFLFNIKPLVYFYVHSSVICISLICT